MKDSFNLSKYSQVGVNLPCALCEYRNVSSKEAPCEDCVWVKAQITEEETVEAIRQWLDRQPERLEV